MLVAGLREHLKDGRLGTHRPRAVLRPFERLTSEEQAAVLHGLRQDAFAWNAFVEKLTSQELEVGRKSTRARIIVPDDCTLCDLYRTFAFFELMSALYFC